MVLLLFQGRKIVGFSSLPDICSLDILCCIMNGLPFSQGQGTFYYQLGKMSAIDHCKQKAKWRYNPLYTACNDFWYFSITPSTYLKMIA